MTDVPAGLRDALAERYPIERLLGRGGMAAVYLARDLKHHRPVALKVLHPELAAGLGSERFLREIRIEAGLQHPNILPLHDSGEAAGFLYYVMPYVAGESLRGQIARHGRLPVPEALRIAGEVADALSHAHERGVVHRDIKPENILLSGGHALVADFGIAKAVEVAGDARLTETGWGMGTPAYMSPEQILGEAVDGRSDVYALGCVLFEMLAGHPPFAGANARAVFSRHQTEPAPSIRAVRPEVPSHIDHAVRTGLAKKPGDRFATAAQFTDALRTPTWSQRKQALEEISRPRDGVSMPPVAFATALQGRYTLERELGRGGMATVYLARDLKHDRPVALKVLHPELGQALGPERFLREIETAAGLQHPHILPLFESGEAGGLLYYAMPYVVGESLRARLVRERQLTVEDARRITCEVADALAYAHAHGVVHRDIKPENILLSEAHALVADFGLAKAVGRAGDERLTATGVSVGTPAYMSPEQVSGEHDLDGRTDIYSLGCVLYEMLAGEAPFTGPTAQAIMAKRLAQPAPSLQTVRDGVPDGVELVVRKALRWSPADRYRTAADLERALQVPFVRPWPRQWRMIIAASALVLAMASATVLLLARRGPELDSRRVAVAAFENQTGDSTQGAFGRILTELVTNALAQTGLVQVVDGSTKQVATARLKSSMSARELAKLTGAASIVSGAYYRDGDSLRIQASLLDARTGRILRTVSPVSVPVSAPLRGIEVFRQRLMGALAIQFDPHFSQWTEVAQEAPTYDAYREFVAAVELYSRGELNDAIPQLSKASALDPNFHLARLWIAEAYISLDNLPKADSVLAVVNASRDQLGRLERAVFDYRLAQRRNDQEATLRYARQAAELWPDRYLLNAASEATLVDHFHEAEQLIRRIDPDLGFMLGWRDEYWGVLTDAEHALGKYEQELEDARRGRKQYPESPWIFSKEIRALVALGRVDEAVALLGVSGMLPIRDADPWWPWHVMLATTAELRAHRHPSAARQTAESALAWLESRSVEEQATAQYRAALCEVHYLAEHWRDAQTTCAQAAARQPPDPEALGRLVSLAGRRGDTAEVERLFAQSGPGSPRIANEADSRARVAALRGQRAVAVRLLKGLKGMFPSTPRDFWFWLHTEVDFDSLRDSPSFQELTRPKE